MWQLSSCRSPNQDSVSCRPNSAILDRSFKAISVSAAATAAAGQRELQVLDYQNVANTLLGLVGGAYACWFMGLNMQARYQK
jgi:hypothetical protein